MEVNLSGSAAGGAAPRSGQKKHAVILNGSFAVDAGGAKRSEGSLTVPWAEVAGVGARVLSRRLRPFTVGGSSLRLCRKDSKGCVQNDGRFFDGCRDLIASRAFRLSFPRLAQRFGNAALVGDSVSIERMKTSRAVRIQLAAPETEFRHPPCIPKALR